LQAFKHSFVVNSSIDRVWEFYTDIKHLEIITPREMKLKVTNATSQKLTQGSEIWLEGKLVITMRRWHSIIKSLSPYQYVDEMLTGPFKKWRHSHKFYAIKIDNNQKQTEVIDDVEFEIPYSPIGKLFESYAYSRIQKLFDHRKAATIRALEDSK
jgi:ligand-binding SRPBCC domain-containing protein